MKIACLGWGSLIWNPESLLIIREWFQDGPLLPIEYTRQSNDGRLTLVISKTANPIRTLWSLMATTNLEEAKNSLFIREKILKKNFETHIGYIKTDDEAKNETEIIIKEWAQKLKLDAVIWTNLPSKFNGFDNQEPTVEEAIQYLNSLDINKRTTAEEYIRKTPKQIDTSFRRKFEAEFGWIFKK